MTIFEQLINTWQRERVESSIIPIEADFFYKCREYIDHLETQSNNDKDKLLSKLFHKRWTRVNYVINDFISIRLEKLVRAILNGDLVTDKLALEEISLRDKLQNQLSSYRDEVLGISTTIVEDEDVDFEAYSLVKFVQNENIATVGVDMKTYGPFREGDIAIIPDANMRNYILRSKVEKIEINK